MKSVVKKIISILFFLAIITLFYTACYIYFEFDNIPFSQLLYSLNNAGGTSPEMFNKGVIYVVPKVIITIGIIYFIQKFIKIFVLNPKKNIEIKINAFSKSFKFKLFSYSKLKRRILYFLTCIILLLCSIKFFRIDTYIYYMMQTTDIYENYFVEAHNVDVSFKDEKRNLIYIIVESEEATGMSEENGGAVSKSYIPNLEKLALDNTNFSNTDKLGGAYQIAGITYTFGSLIAQTAGAPVLTYIGNEYYGTSKSFPGLYTLGEILEKNGYSNYMLMGSEAIFAGTKDYLEQHGNYKVMDYIYAKENKWIDDDYYVWWGYEDKKLFEFAKEQLTEISKKDEPFNFTMMTLDTHCIDGYYDSSCGNKEFENEYANSYYCNDKMIGEFISWIKKQDFYKNTTIVIVGDHLTMQNSFYSNIDSNYKRTIYNTIINSYIKNPTNTKNREYTMLDLYPTTLASIGASIEGDTLGFGVNLYSGKETLIEKLGYDYVDEEFQKDSSYYVTNFLGDTYFELKEKKR